MDQLNLELRSYAETINLDASRPIVRQFSVTYNCDIIMQPDDTEAPTYLIYEGYIQGIPRTFGSLVAGTYLSHDSFQYSYSQT